MSDCGGGQRSSLNDCLSLQGKDDFERQQKELLDKENIMKQSQSQLGQEQVSARTHARTQCGAKHNAVPVHRSASSGSWSRK